MEGQTKDNPMKLESNSSSTADNKENEFKNYSNDLIQEAEAFANLMNERLASLNAEDAELFMINFEKNVVLLPKNTKNATKSSDVLIAQNLNESGHDFVLLDSDDTATGNNDQNNVEMPKGITLFGTSLKYSQKSIPFAFLNNESKNNELGQQEKDSNGATPSNQSISTETQHCARGDCFHQRQYCNETNLPSNDFSTYESRNQLADTKTNALDDHVFNSNRKPRSPSSHRYTNTTEKMEKTIIHNPDEKRNDPFPSKQPPTKPETIVSRPLNLQSISTQVGNVTQQQNDWLQKSSTRNSNRKSINILVLGQTGVGKSTWINAFANYLTYSTLEDAIAAEAPVCVIPTKFSMFDENYQRHDILLGNHSNEIFSDKGQSATQNAKTYLFEKDDYDIYIIDTPGMDDTRGPNQDDENIQKILRAVSPFKELHAICFLFKANESRLTQSFKYCISNLLGNLSKSALNNACFVFTNARGTFYKPGDTMGPLKAYFKELYERERLSVTINDGNTFCLDNEAFRFICAYFSKIKFGDMETKTYADSWRHSSNQIIRLLNYSARLRPHSTSETLSINETRTWILQLVRPVIDVSAIIQTNLCKLEDQIHDLETTENNIQDLQKRAAIPITALVTYKLDQPQTVCASTKCISYEMIDGNLQPIYTTVCHKPCFLALDNVLENCAAFTFDTCNQCGCKVNDHKRISYEQKIVTKHLETQALRNSLASEVDASKFKKRLIRDCEKMTDGYKKELDFVLYAMANFSTFLAQNGISQSGDIFEKHLENLIESEEKMLRSVIYSNDKKYNQSIELLNSYQDTRQKLINENPTTDISLVQIQDIRQKLFSMPLTGSKIAEIFDIHVEADKHDHAENVTRYDPKSMIRKCYNWTKNNVSSFMGSFRK